MRSSRLSERSMKMDIRSGGRSDELCLELGWYSQPTRFLLLLSVDVIEK